MSISQVGIICYILQLCLNEPNLSLALGGLESSFHLSLIAFSFLFSPLSIIIGIGMNIFSRKMSMKLTNMQRKLIMVKV